MDKALKNILLLSLVIIIPGLLLSCVATPPYRPPVEKRVSPPLPPQPPSEPPAGFNIRVGIEHWSIIDHRIMDYEPIWGYFRFSGRFIYNNELVFKFKSQRFPNYYWLAQIPSVEKGEFDIRAVRYPEPFTGQEVKTPPERFSIAIIIRDGEVVRHFIKDPHPWWGQFTLTKFEIDSALIYFRNERFPGYSWVAKMPTQDGEWTIFPELIK